ncbi:helix-turn-helix domain-containing protein [Micrococcus luteus]|nr:helix-turn-helix domain-containing protein [Micrococcus luteus]
MTIERPPQQALEYLRKAMDRSKRKSTVRLPVEFARNSHDKCPRPPLAQMLKGGGHQLHTYLTILMKATRAPHTTKVRTTELAEMLHAAGATDAGKRKIAREIKKLEDPAFPMLQMEREPGRVPTATVLHPDGSGEQWDVAQLPHPYITLPIELWTNGWILVLTPRALGLFIALRELTNGRTPRNTAWVDPIRKKQYGLSKATWTRATAELQDAGLLTVTSQVSSFHGEPRRRNIYTLHVDHMKNAEPGDPYAEDIAPPSP